MKKLFLLTITFTSLNVFAQTTTDFLNSGIEKHGQKDYKGAIKEYDNAIKADKTNKYAFYNKGLCEVALKDYSKALSDFTSTIKIDPEFADAYYNRATTYATNEKYVEALPDLDKTISLKPNNTIALNLRGQIRAQTGNKSGACEDFTNSKKYGDKLASKYLSQFCGNEQEIGESLMLYWPENENWKIGADQESKTQHVIDLIHTNETIDNWTELGQMSVVKGITGVSMDYVMNLMFEQTKENAPKSKLTFIEKDDNAEYPWIIFMLESPSFKNDKIPESQLWYIVQGKESLYTNFRAIKKATIPNDLKEKWTTFFKTGKVITK